MVHLEKAYESTFGIIDCVSKSLLPHIVPEGVLEICEEVRSMVREEEEWEEDDDEEEEW